MAYLILKSNDGDRKRYDLPQEGVATIGRIPERSSIAISGDTISGRHCSITKSGPFYVLKDLDSTNGTFLNGNPIKEANLYLNDEIDLGGSTILIVQGDDVVVRPVEDKPSSLTPAATDAKDNVSQEPGSSQNQNQNQNNAFVSTTTPTVFQISARSEKMGKVKELPTDFKKKSSHNVLFNAVIIVSSVAVLALVVKFILTLMQ